MLASIAYLFDYAALLFPTLVAEAPSDTVLTPFFTADLLEVM